MGYTTSTVHGIEVPDSSEANNVPEDIGKVVTALEAGSLVRRLTGAQIAALTSPQKPAGLVVYNTTTNRLQISDGTNFADLDATAVSALGIANAGCDRDGRLEGDRSGCGHRQRRRCSLRTTDPEVGFGAGQVWRLVWHD